MYDFDDWNKIKKTTEKQQGLPLFREREIWWCKIGRNIGNEINGKGKEYTRPVLIIKKYTSQIFIGIPLTHSLKQDNYHTSFYFNGDFNSVSLFQIRTLDARRLTNKLGNVSIYLYTKILDMVTKAFLKNMKRPNLGRSGASFETNVQDSACILL